MAHTAEDETISLSFCVVCSLVAVVQIKFIQKPHTLISSATVSMTIHENDTTQVCVPVD